MGTLSTRPKGSHINVPIVESRISLSGGDLAYTIAGTGPEVLLLIHGLGGDRRTWRHLIAELAGTHTVIAPDLPGHGDSDPPAGDYSLGAHACAMRDLLLALGHRRTSLIGHSLGGGVALQTAYQFPERVDRLVLISSGGLGREVAPALRAATLPGAAAAVSGLSRFPVAVTKRILQMMPTLAASSDASAVAVALRGLAGDRQRRAFVRTARAVIDWRGQTVSADRQLGLLRDVPVLVAWGTQDTIIPPHHHRSFAERVPHAVMVEIPEAGHFPHETAPDTVSVALQRFLANTIGVEYAEGRWADVLTAPRAPGPSDETARWGEATGTRRVVDTAIGILMELRRCSERDGIRELVLAARGTGTDIADLAQGLVTVSGHGVGDDGPECVAAIEHWRNLLVARAKLGSTGDHGPAVLKDDVTIRYGGVSDLTRC